ncbi:MAG: hypothetical protein FWC76_04915 [Defluviitaleaceae bacterium]|nr:hypothetical protein [Defluviitaleaceae bacterium]
MSRGENNVKKLGMLMIISGGVAVLFFVLLVSTFSSLGRDFSNFVYNELTDFAESIEDIDAFEALEPFEVLELIITRERLESGDIIHIASEREFWIVLEDSRPPTRRAHQFTFTNIDTGERIESRAARFNFTINLYNHGVLIAIANLNEGSYIIEFEPWQGRGELYGYDSEFISIFRSFFDMLLRMVAFGSMGLMFSAIFVVLMIFYILARKAAKREVLHESIHNNI